MSPTSTKAVATAGALIICCLASSAQNQETNQESFTHSAAEHFYTIAKAPAWVSPRDPDLKTPAPFEGPISPGIYFRQVDLQVNAETQEKYYHFTSEFLTVAGVHDDSDFEIEFDPAYQQLAIHRIQLNRNGQVIDILDPETIRITVPEDELSDGLLDGHVTVLVFLEDVRPGDFVEYDYTLTGANPVFEGNFFDNISVEWESSVGSFDYRLLKKKSRALNHRNHGVEIEPSIRPLPDSDLEEWVWHLENIPPKILENRLPDWYWRFSFIELSEFANWQAVAEWGVRHYDFSHLPVDPDLARVIDAIRQEHSTPETRAIAAIRFVQDSIRYLGIEDGANAFRPVQPNQCFQRRFGDCKDKTVLLGQMLRELDIENQPVCLHHARSHAIAELLPSPMAFNHVVIRIKLPSGKFLWCDATVSHQGGTAETLPFPDYRRGLVLDSKTTDLVEIPSPDPDQHRIEITETFRLGEIGEPAVLEVETIFTGSEADNSRYYLESSEPASATDSYLEYYRENYIGIELDGLIEVKDDREANRLVIREHYRFPNPWEPDEDDPGWYGFTLYLQSVRDLLAQPDHVRREMPFATVHPENLRHEIRMHLPGTDDDWAGYFDEERFFIETGTATFEQWMTYDPKKVFATWVATYRTTADAVEPANLRAYDDAIRDIHDLTSLELWEVDEEEEAAAMAQGDGDGSVGNLEEEDWALALAIGFGALVIGVIGFGLGVLLTFLVMRSRSQSKSSANSPNGPPRSGNSGSSPPPLPPQALP